MENKRQNIVSTSSIRSVGPAISPSNPSIDDYIKKVFKKPMSTSLSLSSSSSSSCTWELPSPSSSSLSAPSSSPQHSPKSTLKTPPSSSSECEWESTASESKSIASSDDSSTERWFIHRVRKKKPLRYVVATRYSLLEKPRAFFERSGGHHLL
jgi:predicted secreted protein